MSAFGDKTDISRTFPNADMGGTELVLRKLPHFVDRESLL
jgi:hypothetical protein